MNAIDIIKHFEGLRLKAYPDPASPRGKHLQLTGHDDPTLKADPWTIGYGATGDQIKEGVVWTQEQADADLLARVTHLKAQIDPLLKHAPTANQESAFLSLAYNIGIGAFKTTSALAAFNKNSIQEAADDFLKWNHAGGAVNAGLTKRREEERTLFLTP